jgi:hypothetical protein
MKSKLFTIVGLIVVISMALTACQPAAAIKSKDSTSFMTTQFGEPDTLDVAYDYEITGANSFISSQFVIDLPPRS